MVKRRRAEHGIIILTALMFLNFFALASGLFVFLTRAPEVKANYYMANADYYWQKAKTQNSHEERYLLNESFGLYKKAALETPYNPDLWMRIAGLSAQMDQWQDSRRALEISEVLGADVAEMKSFLSIKPLQLSQNLTGGHSVLP